MLVIRCLGTNKNMREQRANMLKTITIHFSTKEDYQCVWIADMCILTLTSLGRKLEHH